MPSSPQTTPPQIQIQAVLGEEIKTRAANQVNIGMNPEEFVFDFFHVAIQNKTAVLQSRVSLPPRIAKDFLRVLKGLIDSYEKSFGEIQPPVEPQAKIGFDPPTKI